MATFNITSIAQSETTVLHLENAVGEKLYADEAETLPLTIELAGKASKEYKQALSELSRKNVQRKGKQGTFTQNVEDNIELLAAVSKRANNFDLGDKVAIDTLATFRKLYSTPGLYFIRDQVSAELENAEAFVQK